jgi:hypothetical protein
MCSRAWGLAPHGQRHPARFDVPLNHLSRGRWVDPRKRTFEEPRVQGQDDDLRQDRDLQKRTFQSGKIGSLPGNLRQKYDLGRGPD